MACKSLAHVDTARKGRAKTPPGPPGCWEPPYSQWSARLLLLEAAAVVQTALSVGSWVGGRGEGVRGFEDKAQVLSLDNGVERDTVHPC